MAQYFFLHEQSFLIENTVENISRQKITPSRFAISVFARAPSSVMPTGSPSPPYKANPKLRFRGEDLPTKSFSIGGIKREAQFYALGYKKNIL